MSTAPPPRPRTKQAAVPTRDETYDVFFDAPRSPDEPTQGVLSALEAEGFRVFSPVRDLQPGAAWNEALGAALRSARCFVAVSPMVVDSSYGLATAMGKPSLLVGLPDAENLANLRGDPSVRTVMLPRERTGWGTTLRAALETMGVEPDEERAALTVGTRVLSDTPTESDELGFGPVVRGLAALLDDPGTALPLSIGITARWGGGKSSVMLQLRRILDPAHDVKRSWSGDGGRPSTSRAGRWRTVAFPAWLYEGREPLWAALAQAIYEQPQERMSLIERLAFRLRVERMRSTTQRLLMLFVLPVLVAAILAAVAVVQGEAAIGWLAGGFVALAAAKAAWSAAGRSFRSALEKYARLPDYGDHVGFANKARGDVEALVCVLTRDDRALAVFVDDLDRLGSEHAVEVVETVNQMFHASDQPCAFILGFDPMVVAASIEAAYSETIAQLPDGPFKTEFGHEFLSKIVQLVVAVPPPQRTALEGLLSEPPPDERPSRRDARGPRGTAPETTILEEDVRSDQGIRRSKEVLAAEQELLLHLPPNPRQVKRAVNAFRLQLYIAVRDPRRPIELREDDLSAMARYIALRLEYPALAADRTMIAAMESDDSLPDPVRALLLGGQKRISQLDFESFVTIA